MFRTEWRWPSTDERYRKILDMFLDKKSSYYSIHQIGKNYHFMSDTVFSENVGVSSSLISPFKQILVVASLYNHLNNAYEK